MMVMRRLLILLATGAMAGLVTMALAFGPSGDAVLRYAVMSADQIVAGRIIGTAPIDSTIQQRHSTLVVDEVISGPASVGDTLQLSWPADRWYPQPGLMSVAGCGASTQLDTLQGRPALWLLVGDEKLRCAGSPLILSAIDAARRDAIIVAVVEPDTSNIGLVTLMNMHADLAARQDSQDKLAAFVAYLRTR